jgi:septum formation protein
MNHVQIILASASPRRRELLDQIGIRYQVRPVDINETPRKGELPDAYVLRMATEKAAVVWHNSDQELPVLAADTSVVLDGMIMGKPEHEADALTMLSRLSGKTHQVYSAVCLHTDTQHKALSITAVRFRELEHDELLAYWKSGEPADKAGAYAIQGFGALFVESISGSFSGVVGLPLFETGNLLMAAGITIPGSAGNRHCY